MTMKLTDLYASLLKTAFLYPDDEGFISLKLPGGKPSPALIDGKRMVLPLPNQLNNPHKDQIIVFHPLLENIARGESKILERYRQALNMRLNLTVGLVAYQLMMIGTSKELHSSLSPDQLELLDVLKDADAKTKKLFDKIMEAMEADPKQARFVSIFLRKSAKVHGKTHARVAVVGFPFYEELKKGGKEVFGVKIERVKDRAVLMAFMQYLFPRIDELEAYNRGSDSDVAPFMDALMQTVLALASPINAIAELFGEKLGDADDIVIPSDWMESFANLDALYKEIKSVPMQAGNEGSIAGVDASVAPTPLNQPIPAQPAPVMAPPAPAMYPGQMYPTAPVPQMQAAPAPAKAAKGKLDFDSFMQMTVGQPAQPYPFPGQAIPGQAYYPSPGYPAAAPPMGQHMGVGVGVGIAPGWGGVPPSPRW